MWNLHRLTIYDHVLFGNFIDLVISRNNTEQINADNVANKNGTLNEYMDNRYPHKTDPIEPDTAIKLALAEPIDLEFVELEKD